MASIFEYKTKDNTVVPDSHAEAVAALRVKKI